MRVTALILLLASVAAPFGHRECSLKQREPGAAEHAAGHAPSHQHDVPAECTMVGSCASVAAPLIEAVVSEPPARIDLPSVLLPFAYRDPQLTRLKPPPRPLA